MGEPHGECAACECATWDEGDNVWPCPLSKQPCGHHCNHSWSHDSCCWCGAGANDDGEWQPSPVTIANDAGLTLVGCVFASAMLLGPCRPQSRDHEKAIEVLRLLGWAEELPGRLIVLTPAGQKVAPFLALAEEVTRGR